MFDFTKKHLILFFISWFVFTSCNNSFSSNDYSAYFGGEVQNPSSKFILFCKGSKVLDTLYLKENNTFFKKFDSLTPGLYSFKNEPEYQNVFFDKNDSLMVTINSNDFDNSIMFCGRGDQKNNFLMELFLKNEKDKDKMFDAFDCNFTKYSSLISNLNNQNQKKYTINKEKIKWSDDFDLIAKAAVDYSYFIKKEIYPFIHKMRTGNDLQSTIPNSFYDYRKKLDLNNKKLSDFSPYIMYISHLVNNISTKNIKKFDNLNSESYQTSLHKLKIADSLLQNKKIKELIINNIAYQFLQENKNQQFNTSFVNQYSKLVSNSDDKKIIVNLSRSMQNLSIGNKLPEIELLDVNGNKISSNKAITKNMVIVFWTSKLVSHLEAVHQKVIELKKKHPQYTFLAINLDHNSADWKKTLNNYNFKDVKELHLDNFDLIKEKWAISKIHRTIIIDSNGLIKTGLTNIFEINFEDQL